LRELQRSGSIDVMLMPLVAFVRTVDVGSFSGAARVLGLAPSSVARQVDRLESELGARLLVRSSRSLALTPAGARYLPRARRILDEAEQARLEARSLEQEPSGLVRVTSVPSVGQLRICPRLPELFARHPRVRIELDLSSRLVDLRAEGFDVGVRIGQPSDSELLIRRLRSSDAALVCSPELRERLGEPAHPRELLGWPCLTLQPRRATVAWQFSMGAERLSVPVTGALSSRDGLSLYRACLAGVGASVLTRWLLEEDIEAGRLVELLPGWTPALWPESRGAFHLVYPKERRSNAAVMAVVDFLAELGGNDIAR
jgi:DNA-binding transcriptional LysR family regulator